MNALLALPIVLPILSAGVSLASSKARRHQGLVSGGTLFTVWLVSIALLVMVASGPVVLNIGLWPAPIGIVLVADGLSAIMLTTSVTVTLAVLLYSLAQGAADGEEAAPLAVFHPAFLILSAGVSNTFLSGDLFNMYVGFEILLFASFVLITLGGTRDRVRAGTVYIVVSIISSAVFLTGIALTYAAVGTVNLAQIAIRMGDVAPSTALLIQSVLLIGFGVKAAVFPLSAWLPDSYPTAPAPVTAVFAGLLTKVGVYGIIRTQTLLFPGDRLALILGLLAIATMLIGILGALAQQDIKRLLSFTLVSHIGYMLWGVSVASAASLGSTVYYAAHHITVQTALFLVVGLIERIGGSTSLTRLGSLLKASPLLAILYIVPAFNLAGVPPGSGFFGKVGLISASVGRSSPIDWVLIGAGLLTSLLTLYAVARAWNMMFWQEAPEEPSPKPVSPSMTIATAGLVAVSLGISFLAGPINEYTKNAGARLLQRSPYIVAVLPPSGNAELEEGREDPDSSPIPSVEAPREDQGLRKEGKP